MMNRVTEAMGAYRYLYLPSEECGGACSAVRAERNLRDVGDTSDPSEENAEQQKQISKVLKVVGLFVAAAVVVSLIANWLAGRRRDDGDDDAGDDAATPPRRSVSPPWSPEAVRAGTEIGTSAAATSITADNEPRYVPPVGLRGVWAGHHQLKNFAGRVIAPLGQQLTEFVTAVIAVAPRVEASFAIGCTEGLRTYWGCAERDNSREASRWAESMLLAGDSMERGVFGQAAIAHEKIARELQLCGVGSDGAARELHMLCAAHCRFIEAQRVQMCHVELETAHIKAAHAMLTQSQFTLLPLAAQQHAALLTQMASARLVAFGGRL